MSLGSKISVSFQPIGEKSPNDTANQNSVRKWHTLDGVIKPSEQIFKTIVLIKPDNIEIIFTKSQRIPDVFLRHLKVIIPFMRWYTEGTPLIFH